MNLFVLAWNLPKDQHSMLLAELRNMSEVYPQLDPGTLWHWDKDGTAFAASMHQSDKKIEPRRYVCRSDDQVTFYDGCLVDRTGTFAAHDAESLRSHWHQLSEHLEGQYVVVRLTDNPICIDLLTDFLGMAQVYYFNQGNMWVVSNSVKLILRITGATTLDSLGISLFLTMGWVGDDRTLRRDIRVIPGGNRWIWKQGNLEPNRKVYFPRGRLSPQRQRALTQTEFRELANELGGVCYNLAENFEDLRCTLTGGRDSRLLTCLLLSRGIQANYHTDGLPGSSDVEIASQIAKTFLLPHKVNIKTIRDVTQDWDALCRRLILQNDGMVSLWQINDALQPSHLNRLGITFWGIGGEIARCFYTNPRLFLRRRSSEEILNFMIKLLVRDFGGLIRDEAKALAVEHIKHFVAQAIDEGFSSLDVPDLFYAYDRVRRWAGSNARKAAPVSDLFSPFVTRVFAKAAFTMPAKHRYSEPIHYELIRMLVPGLQNLPFAKGPWRSQRPFVNLMRLISHWPVQKVQKRIFSRFLPKKQLPAFEVYDLLASKRQWLRELCLDKPDSVLWTFVNRSVFESFTSDAPKYKKRLPYSGPLYDIATLFYYSSS